MRRFQRFALLAMLVALFCAPIALAQDGGTQDSGTDAGAEGSSDGGDTTYEAPDTINVDMSDEGGANEDAGVQESVGEGGINLWTILIVVVVGVLLIALIAVAVNGRDRPPRY